MVGLAASLRVALLGRQAYSAGHRGLPVPFLLARPPRGNEFRMRLQSSNITASSEVLVRSNHCRASP